MGVKKTFQSNPFSIISSGRIGARQAFVVDHQQLGHVEHTSDYLGTWIEGFLVTSGQSDIGSNLGVASQQML